MQDIKIDHLVVIPFDSGGLFAVYGDLGSTAKAYWSSACGPVTDKNDFPRRYIADPLHTLTVDVAEPGSVPQMAAILAVSASRSSMLLVNFKTYQGQRLCGLENQLR